MSEIQPGAVSCWSSQAFNAEKKNETQILKQTHIYIYIKRLICLTYSVSMKNGNKSNINTFKYIYIYVYICICIHIYINAHIQGVKKTHTRFSS